MVNRKKVLKITIVIILFLAIVYQFADLNYTYIEIEDKLYVLTHQMTENEVKSITPIEIGKVEKRIPLIFNPKKNNVSNGIVKGTKIYRFDEDSIMIEYKGKNYCLTDKEEANLVNGMIIRLR